jgi:hypothetical protein
MDDIAFDQKVVLAFGDHEFERCEFFGEIVIEGSKQFGNVIIGESCGSDR